jgi:uncharacterized protein (DUF1330 family)
MAKAYWIACYRAIKDADKLAAYAKLAGPAIAAANGRFLVRGMPAKTYEAGENQRTVMIEFDSVAAATAAHDSAGYQAALAALETARCAISVSSKAFKRGCRRASARLRGTLAALVLQVRAQACGAAPTASAAPTACLS